MNQHQKPRRGGLPIFQRAKQQVVQVAGEEAFGEIDFVEPEGSPVNPSCQPQNGSEGDDRPEESGRAAGPGDFAGGSGYARGLGEGGHRALW